MANRRRERWKQWQISSSWVLKSLQMLTAALKSEEIWLRKINPEYSSEGLILKLKLQYFGHLMWTANSLVNNRNLFPYSSGGNKAQSKALAGLISHGTSPWLAGGVFSLSPHMVSPLSLCIPGISPSSYKVISHIGLGISPELESGFFY